MNKIPDSEWLASMVAAAYSEQRYDLGEALARLCGQAYRMERSGAIATHVPGCSCQPGSTVIRCRPGEVRPSPTDAPAPRPEPMHVQDLVRTHDRADDQPIRVEWCEACDMMIKYSDADRTWQHINAEGSWVTSPLPAHLGRPPTVETSGRAAPAEASTLVTPSARCVAILGRFGSGTECHGVLYWSNDVGGAPGWVHLEPDQENHIAVANVPNPVTP